VVASSFSKEISVGLEGFRLEEIASALGRPADRQEIALIDDFPGHCPDRELSEWAKALSLKSCWSAPVVDARDRLLGVIAVFFRDLRPYTPRDRNRLQVAAGMASIAIEHRRLTDRLSYQAQHDALTGLSNRFLLGDRLEQAIAYSNRHRSGLAVLLLNAHLRERVQLMSDLRGR
jgi:GAF domain-containing protein